MMDRLDETLTWITDQLWGAPTIIILLGTGLLITFITRGVQFYGLAHACRIVSGYYRNVDDPGEISHFRALATALSATIGLGSIAGVAVAMTLGGPGAMFWMIISGIIGMATKFAECTLAVMFRKIDKEGKVHGGPMYYIELGLGKSWRPLSQFFALSCAIAAIGSGNLFQTNQVATVMHAAFSIPLWVSGLVLAALTVLVVIGGIQRIGAIAGVMVPVMGFVYVIASCIVVFANYEQIPSLIAHIFHDAFSGSAVLGGVAGVSVREAMIHGLRRATFINEAGLGSSAIAHATASTQEPVRQGLVALFEPLVTSVIICSMTAMVIMISDGYQVGMPLHESGAVLTARAFNEAISGFGAYFIPIAVLLFGFSTVLSFYYYGTQAIYYLFGEKGVLPYQILYCGMAFVGACTTLQTIIAIADTFFALMIIPNLTGVLFLLPHVRRANNSYFQRLRQGEFG